MKSKEEVLNNALIVLNKPDKPWEVTITNDSIVAKCPLHFQREALYPFF